MCELLAVSGLQSGRICKLGELLELAAQMERYGIAGFGWGIAWHTQTGDTGLYKRPIALREDREASSTLSQIAADAALIHLRRPSQLLTMGLADTQPFASATHGCFFAHNGEFSQYTTLRNRYKAAGLLAGRADSEVGFRLFEELLATWPPEQALAKVHQQLQGEANLLALLSDGTVIAYAANEQNPLYRFVYKQLDFITTSIYSADQALFQWVFPEAQHIQQLPLRTPTHLGKRAPTPVTSSHHP